MALITCNECGKEYSDKASACPNCGCPTVSANNADFNTIIMHLDGANGQIDLYRNRIVITRKGALAKMTQGLFKGNKEIFLNQISAIQIKEGGFVNGYIQFTLAGGNEKIKGISEAPKDENTIMFSKKQNHTARMLKAKIYELK